LLKLVELSELCYVVADQNVQHGHSFTYGLFRWFKEQQNPIQISLSITVSI